MNMPSFASSLEHDGSIKQDVTRNTVNFHPSIWGDQFLTYEETNDGEWGEQQVNQLKEEVRKMLVINTSTQMITHHRKLLELIDAIQRLGVAYHFEEEIEKCLKHILHLTYGDLWVNDNLDLQTASLWFRLLRQQGFNVSSGVFNKYKNNDGRFMESIIDDVQGMLSLYEASYMRIEGEQILDEAIVFTTCHLSKKVENLNDGLFKDRIHQALQQPLRKRLPRLEALRYIPIYQQEPSHNEVLLKFAKLDFNLLQKLHRKELSEISRWWKDLDVSKRLPYVRDRIVEGYFWILAVYFEPQHSDARIFLMKACNLVIILDDTYDNYGTYQELEIFTEAIQRWSISCLDMLPEYMKLIYKELLDVHKEAEELLEKKGKLAYRIYYTREMVKDYARNLLIEAKWANEGYTPTVEEHMSVTLVTCAYAMIIAKCYVYEDDLVTEDTYKWVSEYPPLVKASCLILRLMDDIATHKKLAWTIQFNILIILMLTFHILVLTLQEEQERNHVASSIECYMKQYGVTEEHTHELFTKQVEDEWKVINQESLRPTDVPRPLLMPPINLARVCDVLYTRGDDYNHAGKEMINYIKSLLVYPINVQEAKNVAILSTMELLSFSTPSSYCPPSSISNLRQLLPTKPSQSLSLRRLAPPQTSVRCSIGSSPQTLGFDFNPTLGFSASSPQTPATAMRDAESDAMGLLLRERIVFLGTQIDDFVADAIISQLLLLDAQDPSKDIRLFVNSTGGSLSASMAIYDVLKLVRADVSTIALGISASTASIILGGGTKGKRLAMPNTRIMIHQPMGGASGQAIDVEIQAREMMHNKDNVTRILAESTGRSYEQVQKDIDRDRYMSPIEAVEYGIIDGVIDEDSIIPLEPVPDRVKSTLSYDAISKDPEKFMNPEIPDDEIY
ncbi:hypothetical protein LXL04_026028 [Taraxacum kok-saghyz]